MRETIERKAENLNNLLQSEVSYVEEKCDGYSNLYRCSILVMHHTLHDGTEESIDKVYEDAENEMTMVWAYLKKTLMFGCDDDKMRLSTSFLSYAGGQVGFIIEVGEYFSCK